LLYFPFFLFSFREKKRERSKEKRKANGKYINKKLENDKKERHKPLFHFIKKPQDC